MRSAKSVGKEAVNSIINKRLWQSHSSLKILFLCAAAQKIASEREGIIRESIEDRQHYSVDMKNFIEIFHSMTDKVKEGLFFAVSQY